MESDDQSNIPTKPVIIPGSGEPSLGVSDAAAAMLGAGRSQGPGLAWQPPSPEELQRDFPLYEIRGILGRGGMGAVYRGWQKSLDRFVALKILPPGLDDGIAGFTERFKREAKAMAQLQHPGIVAVFDAGTTSGGLLYFVMECVTGTDVHRLLSERGRLDPAEALRITSAVCDALGYAHEHGIIHRDIKPSNIMLDAHGAVKVADFGLAKSTSAETTMLTMSNVTMGTPEFMAPEALKGAANVDHRADLYAVGVMLYQMLTGELPRGRFVPPSRAVPGLDKRLDAIVDRTLQPEPAARYSTAIELRTALEPVTRAIAKRTVAITRAAARKKPPALAAVVFAVFVVIAALVYFAPWKKVGASGGVVAAPKPAGAVAATSPSPAWEQNMFATMDRKDATQGKGKAEMQGAFLHLSGDEGWSLLLHSHRDVLIRTTLVWDAKLRNVKLIVRDSHSRAYYARLQPDAVGIGIQDGVDKTLKHFPVTPTWKEGDEVTFQFASVGSQLAVWVNGQLLGTVTDATITGTGEARLSAGEGRFKTLDILPLDGLPEAEALKLAGVSATSKSPALPVSASTTSPDRQASLRVLEKGRSVTIQTSTGAMQTLSSGAALPDAAFSLVKAEVSSEKNDFNDADMALFAGLPKLEFIFLRGTAVTPAGLAVLKTLPALKSIQLDGVKAIRDDDLKLLQDCRALDTVSLMHGERFTSAALEHLSAVGNLHLLEISGIDLRNEDVKHLLRLKKLDMLWISQVSLSADALEQLRALPKLSSLRISLTKLERPVNFALFKLDWLVVHEELTRDAVESLTTATSLSILNLQNPGRLEAATVAKLAASLKNLRVFALGLYQPLPPGDPLAALAALPKLENVSISRTGIVTNQFDDAALLSLAKVTSLKQVTFESPAAGQPAANRVTSQGLAAFRKLRPDVKIDGLPEAEALKLAGVSAPAAPQWLASDFATLTTHQIVDRRLHLSSYRAWMPDKTVRPQNVVMRASLIWKTDTRDPKLESRYLATGDGANLQPTTAWFARFSTNVISIGITDGKDSNMRSIPLNPPIQAGDKVTLKFASIGHRHLAWVNEKLAGDVMDERLIQNGPVRLSAGEALFDSFEYLPLDGLPEAEALKLAGISEVPKSPAPQVSATSKNFPPGQWVRAFATPEELPEWARKQWVDVVAKDGWWTCAPKSQPVLTFCPVPMKNSAVRARLRWPTDGKALGDLSLSLRRVGGFREGDLRAVEFATLDWSYRTVLRDTESTAPGQLRQPAIGPEFQVPPLKPGQEFTFELAVIGTRVAAKFDGLIVSAGTTSITGQGIATIMTQLSFRDVEVLNLDGLPEAEALKLAGISEAPKSPTPQVPASPTSSVSTFAGHRYQFVPSKASWSEAKAQAEALGGHLATITSAEEHAWFMQAIAPLSKHVWLGGRRQAEDGSWAWITGEPWKFTAWARHADGTMEPVKPAPGAPLENILEFGYYPPTFAAPGWNDEQDRARAHPDAGYLVEWDSAGK